MNSYPPWRGLFIERSIIDWPSADRDSIELRKDNDSTHISKNS